MRDGFNLERVIDDFIFLCFFVGNDFLPHMPALDIRDGAIDAMLLIYKKCVSSHLHGYVTCNGEVNFPRLQALLIEFGTLEKDIFQSKRYQDQQAARQRERRDKQARRVGGRRRTCRRTCRRRRRCRRRQRPRVERRRVRLPKRHKAGG